jgi:hypothetical protein
MGKEQFINEEELRLAITRDPSLVRGPGDAPLFVVRRELHLSTGRPDAFLLDAAGLPVVVEAKINGAAQRRYCAGQVLDYAAELCRYTAAYVDTHIEGDISGTLEHIAAVTPEASYDQLSSALEDNLRAGRVRLIIATDQGSAELGRIMGFLTAHGLDARTVEIEKYEEAGVVTYRQVQLDKGGCRQPEMPMVKGTPGVVWEAYEHYRDNYDYGFPSLAQGETYWIQLNPEGWPLDVHYEFCQQHGDVEVALHAEKHDGLLSGMEQIAREVRARNPRGRVVFAERAAKFLRMFFVETEPVDRMARCMKDLIDLTFEEVSQRLRQPNQESE